MICNGDKPDRLVILVIILKILHIMLQCHQRVKLLQLTILTIISRTVEGKKYLALVSNGDIKSKDYYN